MFDLSKSFYEVKVTDFKNIVSSPFILNGAFCSFDGASVTPPTTPSISTKTIPKIVLGIGMHYPSSLPSPVVSPSPSISPPSTGASSSSSSDIKVYFTFYKRFDKSLKEDVSGKIWQEGDEYYLEIDGEVGIINFLPHNYLKVRFLVEGDFTVNSLRDVLGHVRAMLMLAPLDNLHDVIPVPSPKSDLDEILEKIKEYVEESIESDFIFDLCVKSSISSKDKIILNLSIHKPDGSLASKDLIKIELYARAYEPAIVFRTFFENDPSNASGVFTFLKKGVSPYKISKMISPDESSYFIRGIMKIVSNLEDYRYVITK